MKTFGKIWNAITTALVVAVVLLALMLAGLVTTRKKLN